MRAPDLQSVLAMLDSADRLLVQRVFKPIGNEYRISVPAPGSTDEGRPLLYVRQKKLKLKEDIRFRLSPEDDDHVRMPNLRAFFNSFAQTCAGQGPKEASRLASARSMLRVPPRRG